MSVKAGDILEADLDKENRNSPSHQNKVEKNQRHKFYQIILIYKEW